MKFKAPTSTYFPHIQNIASNKLIKSLTLEDFEAGLNIRDTELLKKAKIKEKGHDLWNVWLNAKGSEFQNLPKEQTRITAYTQALYKEGLYTKNDLSVLLVSSYDNWSNNLNYGYPEDLVIFCIKESPKILSQPLEVCVPQHMYKHTQTQYTPLPVLFTLEGALLQKVLDLTALPDLMKIKATVSSGSYDLFEWSTLMRGKRKLAVLEEKYPEYKISLEEKNIQDFLKFYENKDLLQLKLADKKNIQKFLLTEIQAHNTQVVHYIQTPLFQQVFDLEGNRNPLEAAIRENNIPLIEKLITFPYYQAHKSSTYKEEKTSYVYLAAEKNQSEVERFLLEKDFYELEVLKKEVVENYSKFNDKTFLTLLKKDIVLPLEKLIVDAAKESYHYLLTEKQQTPHILKYLSSDNFLKEINAIALDWSNSVSRYQYRTCEIKGDYKGYRYAINQNWVPIIITTLNALKQLSTPEATKWQKEIEKSFLKSLQNITASTQAGYAINQYLKYEPGSKTKVIDSLSASEKPWVVKLGKKNLQSQLDEFLKSAAILPKKNEGPETAPQPKRHKI